MEAIHQRLSHINKSSFDVYYSNESSFPTHWHESIELVYSFDDGLDISINEHHFNLEAGDIALINTNDIHSFPYQTGNYKRMIIQIDTYYHDVLLKTLVNNSFSYNIIKANDNFNESNILYTELSESILTLQKEINDKTVGYEIALNLHISKIVITLLRYMPMKEYSAKEKRKNKINRERLTGVLKYIEENYKNNITLEEIAKIAKYSTYHFTRFFKESLGMTFTEYLRNYRIMKSIGLLLNTNDSITEIAYNVGFGSSKSYNRIFKEREGYSPSQYRKMMM